jgi:hypothetical protein
VQNEICFDLAFSFLFACSNSQTVTPTESSDSAIKAIDPNGTISDTSQYSLDSSSKDSANKGLTH